MLGASHLKRKTTAAGGEDRLLACFRRLDEGGRQTLLEFAEFLAAKAPTPEPEAVPEPLPIERPTEESVVKAIKRLTATYPMVERGELLNEISALMAQHVMQGRPAVEVIDELEIVFRRRYELLVQHSA